jgi:hypothetical protein
MGLLDITTNVLTLYKADTSDQKAKVKELIGLEKEQAEQALKSAEARNKGLESTIDKLGKVGLAFNTLATIARGAFEGLELYGKRLDLEAAAGEVSIEKLSKAAGGLKSEMELLQHAAVLNKSAFQLTEDQMATVESAMRALEDRGRDGAEVWNAVSSALTKGTTKALEGIVGPIQKSSDAFDVNGEVLQTYGARAKAVDAILKKLAETSKELGDGQYDEADRIQSVTVKITDAMDHIKQSIGKLVASLEPLIRLVALLTNDVSTLLDKIAVGWQDIVDVLRIDQSLDASDDPALKRIADRHKIDINPYVTSGDRFENYVAQGGNAADFITSQLLNDLGKDPNADKLSLGAITTDLRNFAASADLWSDRVWALLQEKYKVTKERYQEAQAKAKELAEERRRYINEVGKRDSDELVKRLEAELADSQRASFSRELRALSDERAPAGADVQSAQLEAALKARTAEAYDIFQREKTGSFLEQTFGKVEEFNVYRSAFESLSTAVTSGFEAWISGSKSFSAAFREALSKTMAGEALSMAAQAIKATALGIFSAATGNAPAAATYFTSAAQFTAAAIAFGAGAAAMGSGGGASSRGAGASAPNVAATASAPAGSGTQSIIVVGDSFAEDSPRMRQIRAERLVAMARGNTAVVYE